MKKAEEKIKELLERTTYRYQSEVVHQSCFGRIAVETCLTKKNLVRHMVTFKTPEGKKTFSCLDECSQGQAGCEIYLKISKIVNDIRKNMCFLRKFGFSMSGYGVNYIKKLLNSTGRDIEIVNEVTEDKQDLVQNFVSIITSFYTRIYGLRRSRRKTEKLIRELEKNNAAD